jgi:hypothetical protein
MTMLPPEDSRLLKTTKSSTLAPSPLQTKPSSAPRIHSSSTPSSAYQAYRQGERDAYSASKPKPAAHPHLPSGHISSPPRPAVRKESEWSPAAARQPSASPRIYPANFIGPIAPGATRQSSPPKPESSKPRVYPANFIGPIALGSTRQPKPGQGHGHPSAGTPSSPKEPLVKKPLDGGQVVYPRGPGASEGPVPPGHTQVSRWVNKDEAKLWLKNEGTAIPSRAGTDVGGGARRIYVTTPGAAKPGGTGPIRIDFHINQRAVANTAGKPEWRQIFGPVSNTPVHNVKIHLPPGVTLQNSNWRSPGRKGEKPQPLAREKPLDIHGNRGPDPGHPYKNTATETHAELRSSNRVVGTLQNTPVAQSIENSRISQSVERGLAKGPLRIAGRAALPLAAAVDVYGLTKTYQQDGFGPKFRSEAAGVAGGWGTAFAAGAAGTAICGPLCGIAAGAGGYLVGSGAASKLEEGAEELGKGAVEEGKKLWHKVFG